MERKQYDLMMNMAGNQNASYADFTAAGFNVDNTSLQDISVYRNDPYISILKWAQKYSPSLLKQ